MYNHMTEEDGRKVCMKGWEIARIKERLPTYDSFNDIYPITKSDLYSQATSINMTQESLKYVSSESVYMDSKSDDKWFGENEDIVFDCFDNENENV